MKYSFELWYKLATCLSKGHFVALSTYHNESIKGKEDNVYVVEDLLDLKGKKIIQLRAPYYFYKEWRGFSLANPEEWTEQMIVQLSHRIKR